MQRFPAARDHLRHMYLCSQSFQTLCDDYQKCLEALDHWKGSRHVQAAARSREYQELKQDLEVEIEERIGAMR